MSSSARRARAHASSDELVLERRQAAAPLHIQTRSLIRFLKLRDLYGRAALDMKSTGVLQLMAAVAIKRAGIPLAGDVIVLATADEEDDSELGADFVARHRAAWLANPAYAAAVRTSFALTMLRTGDKRSVVPAEATAEIDCRVLIGDDPRKSWSGCGGSSTSIRSR